MKKERKVWAITSIVLWLLAPNQINAQQDASAVHQLEEVVITATKFPKNQTETGKVLTIIDEDVLKRSAGKDIAQLLNEQVGMAVSGSNSNTGKDKSVYLRGAKNEYTLILLDGVPLNDPSGISGGAYDLRLISLDQVERIEILKGSQSTLYGSDAIAGVINIITKKSEEKGVELFGTIGYGSYNSVKGSAGVRGATKHVGYNLSYSGLSSDGISEASENGTVAFDKDGASQSAFQTSVDFKPTTLLSVRPFFRYSKFEGKYDGGAYTDDLLNNYAATLLNTGLHAGYSLKKGAINFQYAYDQTDRSYDGTYGKSEYFGKFHLAELFANYTLGNRLQLLAGIANQEYKMLDKTATEADPSVTLLSPYLSVFSHFGNFSAEIGGRYNHHTKFGENFTYSFNPSYRMKNNLKLFYNLSTGFKAPSLYQLYGEYGANPQLKPEKSLSNEIGAQWLSPEKKTELRIVAFTRSIKDVIIYAYPANVNLDNQNDLGIEVESSFTLSNQLNVKVFYSFVDGNVKTQVLGKDTTYHNLFRRPKHMAGVNLGYQLNNQFFISINTKFFGERNDLYFDTETFTNQSVNLNAYTLVDLYGEYRLKKMKSTLFADIKNILNTDYQEVYGYSTMGININAGIAVRF
jgi:vitamin B12 transporter